MNRGLVKLVLVFCEMMMVGMVRRLVIMMHRKHMSSSVPVHVTRHMNLNNASDYHLDLVKNPENVYTVHLCIDSINLFVYC